MARATNGNRSYQPPYDPLMSIVVDLLLDAAKNNDAEWLKTKLGSMCADFVNVNQEAAIAALERRRNGNGHE